MTTTEALHLAAITPINLPRYTILFGPLGSGQKELASALSDLDPGIAIMDLEGPLRAATMELFWGGFDYELDLTDKAQLDAMMPFESSKFAGLKTNKDWLDTFAYNLRVNLGDDILARIALRETERMLIHHERIIFRDVQSSADLEYLASNLLEPVTVCASNATLKMFKTNQKVIYLHSLDPSENISLLRRELGDLP